MEPSTLNLLGATYDPISGNNILWDGIAPSANHELGVKTISAGDAINVAWGDGSEDSVGDDIITTHLYDGSPLSENFGISNKGDITEFYSSAEGGDGWPADKFGGQFDARAIPYAWKVYVDYHDLASFAPSPYTREVRVIFNKLTGLVTDYLAPSIQWLELQFNLLTGPIPDLSSYRTLIAIGTTGNTGIGGSFPTLPPQIQIVDFALSGISGDLPILTQYSELNRCWMYHNPGLTVPTNWAAPASLNNLIVSNCGLTSTEVDTVLVAMESLGTSDGNLIISNNSAPSGVGITAKSDLEGRGWTVDTA